MTRPPTIGIIAGSGPEAGIDLWQKVVDAARVERGTAYLGDGDAPRVVVVSEPALGASMDLPTTDHEVWTALEATARDVADRCDVYAIACNTLNVYADRLEALDLGARLVSFPAAVGSWAAGEGVTRVALLAAAPVAALGEWSPYQGLLDVLDIESHRDPGVVHALIQEVKSAGATDAARARFAALVDDLDAPDVVLACTELPMVAAPIAGRRLVDVTELVATELIRCWSRLASG